MKKLVRRVVVGAVLILILGVVVLGVLSWMASRFVSEAGLVRMAEEEINSRVHIGEARLSLLRLPATITMKEVALAPRDGEVGMDLAERAEFDYESAPVRVKEVRLAVSLAALLARRMEIREFVCVKPHLAVTLQEDGENSLDELLRTPGGRKRETREPEIAGEGGGADGGKGKDKDDEVLNTKSLNVYAHGFLARLQGVHMRDASLDLTIEKTGMVIKARNLSARLEDIDLDPAALEQTNTARVHLQARIEIDAVEKDLRYAEIHLAGPAQAKLFDPESGDLDLDVRGDFELGTDSYLNAHVPVVQKVWDAVGKLDAIGLKIGELPEKATFGRSNSIAVHYHGERFALSKPISLWFDDWEFAVLDGTWIQAEQAEHHAELEVMAQEKLSGKLRGQIGNGVDHLPSELRPILVEEVEATWFRDGRLLARIKSKGELASPSVELRNKFPDLRSLARKAAEKLLGGEAGGFLRDLLGD